MPTPDPARDWQRIVSARLADAGLDPARERDIVDELAQHVEDTYLEALEAGMPEAAAFARALQELADATLAGRLRRATIPPVARRVNRWGRLHERTAPSHGRARMMSAIWQDVRYAARLLAREPGFAAVVIATLALGIGANTAIFSVVNGVLLKSLPYPRADRLAMVWMDNRQLGITDDVTSYPNYLDWRNQNTSFEHLAGYSGVSFNLTGDGEPERLRGALATASFFDVLGVPALVGRTFDAAHETPGRDRVVVLTHGLWQRRFGGDPDIVGRSMVLGGNAFEVIGVMPPEVRHPDDVELWKPLAVDDDLRAARGAFWLPVIGRLKDGVSVAAAQAEMSAIAAQLEQAYPRSNTGFGANVVPLHDQIVGGVAPVLLTLLGAVGFVLLITCANVANLLLTRATAREREIAVRSAMGAGRRRLMAQMLAESLVLALAGGLLGVLLAYWGLGVLVPLGAGSIPRLEEIALDGSVLLFTLAVSMATGLLFGLAPAWQALRPSLVDMLKEGGRGSTGGTRRLRGLLVVAEVALALVLLVGAGLMTRSLLRMQRVDRGFATDRVLTFDVGLPPGTYRGPDDIRSFFERLQEKLRVLPGVESASATTGVFQPLLPNSTYFTIEGRPPVSDGDRIEIPFEMVAPGYFETLRIPFVRGRPITVDDGPDAPRAIVVNDTMARMFFPNEDPIGKRVKPGREDSESPWRTVVGVIRDLRRSDLRRSVRPEIYFSALQSPQRTMTMVLRTSVEPQTLVAPARAAVRELDVGQPIFLVQTVDRQIDESMARERLNSRFLIIFSAVALGLAAIGIFGVMSFVVASRTREVGIRLALGAQPGDVRRLVIRQGLGPVAVGLGIGLAGTLLLTRYLQSLLFEVEPTDPVTYLSIGALLLAVAIAACYLPARRATRVDPLVALRVE